jgi:hypothetical protein
MKIEFYTKQIDETFYRQIIQQYIADHLTQSSMAFNRYNQYHDDWTINVKPVEDWDGTLRGGGETGTLNGMIPHGVTGEGIVTVYVVDSADKGLMAIQNFGAVLHEVAHMLLIILMRGQRGIFRNNDLSGNKKGMDANISTQEVHDRQMEGNTYQVRGYVNFGNWLIRNWVPYTAIGIDLRDFIKNNV